ncbi:YIP1 family protein [Rhodobacter sp. Har01]|uniref:YIP1 family protein n=1 Tax=Rhodobacter sp. Har01 TaxID=2883999 RepID=UPI001D0660E0|nr:YIP1 family protein [Rhodobacter sp. Har01]MCB6177144.1 YIP1 family protein [Rhodobacter sp. Har01]
MAVSTDIVATWTRPRQVFRRLLDRQGGEAQALAYMMGACLLIFVAQWPRLSRQAHQARQAAEAAGTPVDQVPSLQALMGINLFALLFLAPLLFYALAGLAHAVAKGLGGKGSAVHSRLALFWALLAVSPWMLFQGLVAGFIGPGPALTATGVAVAAGFLWLWITLMREAHRP